MAGHCQSKALVEFRAGKMNRNATNKMVTADMRKGLVSVYQDDDQLLPTSLILVSINITMLITDPSITKIMAYQVCIAGWIFVGVRILYFYGYCKVYLLGKKNAKRLAALKRHLTHYTIFQGVGVMFGSAVFVFAPGNYGTAIAMVLFDGASMFLLIIWRTLGWEQFLGRYWDETINEDEIGDTTA